MTSKSPQSLESSERDPLLWAAAWDANAQHRSVELTSNIDSAYLSLADYIEQHLNACVSLGSRVLDAGCGTGALSSFMNSLGFRVVGIDPSRESVRYGKLNYPEVEYYSMSIENFCGVDSAKFDSIVANMVLHTAYDVDSFLAASHSLLAEDGVLIVTLPHPWHYLRLREDLDFDLASYYDERFYWLEFRIHGQGVHPHKVPYIHRPLEWYISSLTRNGFILKELDEPLQVGNGKPRDIVILRAVRDGLPRG